MKEDPKSSELEHQEEKSSLLGPEAAGSFSGASFPPPPLDIQAEETSQLTAKSESGLANTSVPATVQLTATENAPLQREWDPEAIAAEMHRLIEAIEAGSEDNTSLLTQQVENIPNDKAEEVKAAYQQAYGTPLIDDLYALLSGPNGGHLSSLYASTSWLVNSYSSDHAPGSDVNHDPRSGGSNDLLPGSDPYYGNPSGHNGITVNVAGQYAAVGESVEITHSDNTQYWSAPGSPSPYPFMEMIMVKSPSGEKRRFNFHSRANQTLNYTPQEEGKYDIMAWIRHPDDHVEVIFQSFDAKTLVNVSREARDQVQTANFDTFRTQLELQEIGMSSFAVQDQQTGDQFITSQGANPTQGRIGNDTSFVANGFDAGTIKWYAKVEAENMPTQTFYSLNRAPSEASARFHCGPNETLYSAGQGNSTSIPLYSSGIFSIIAEGVQDGERTGEIASYRQVVLNSSEAEQLNNFREYKGQVDEYIEKIPEGQEVPVQAAYTNEENVSSVAITLYIGPSAEDPGNFVLVDFTPGVTRREYSGSTVQACLDDFANANTYPDGSIALTIPENGAGVQSGSWTIETDGASFLQSLSSGAGWASLGFAVGGIIASVVPGGQAFAPFLFIAAAATGAASGALSLADRFREAEVSSTGVTLDLLTIASSILGGAAAFKAVRGGAAALQLTAGGRFLLYSSLAADGASALVMSVQGADQIAAILDSDMPRGEKAGAIARIVANLAVTGGLFMLSVGDLNSAKRGLASRFGDDVIDAMDDHTLYALSMLDEAQLTSLQQVPNAQLSEFLGVIAQDWAKGQRLLALANFTDISSFRAMFDEMSLNDLLRLERVIGDSSYMSTLSDNMRERYTRIVRELGDDLSAGRIDVDGIRQRISVMEEIQSTRTALNAALSDAAGETANIGARNMAYGDFNINLPGDAGNVSESVMSISGKRSSATITDDLGETSFGGRNVVPDLDNGSLVFRHTEGRAKNEAERKLFEYLIDQMEAQIRQQPGQNRFRFQAGQSYAGQGYSGTINLFSEMKPCDSCAEIISQQFRAMFGSDITVNVTYGVTYP